jgi:hypothetical protein
MGSDFVSLAATPINVRTPILWVNKENGMDYPTGVIGLVGMGYSTSPNFLDSAYSANQIKTAAFALQILNTTQQSILYYDEIPESIVTKTIMINQFGSGHWQV